MKKVAEHIYIMLLHVCVCLILCVYLHMYRRKGWEKCEWLSTSGKVGWSEGGRLAETVFTLFEIYF